MQFTRPAKISPPLMLLLFFKRAPCRFPSLAQGYAEDRLDLNKLLIKHPNVTYLIKVSGEFMRDVGISNGDLLVADRSLFAVHGNIVIAVIAGESTVKEFCTRPPLQLAPYDRNYVPVSLHNAEELEVFGAVIFSIKAHK